MIECHSCHRELPESAYSPSGLNRGYIFCRDCCKKWNRESKKRYLAKRKQIKNYKETMEFDSYFGGYTISMLYNPKKGESKYAIYSTKTNETIYTDEPTVLQKWINKALKDVCNNTGNTDGKKKD